MHVCHRPTSVGRKLLLVDIYVHYMHSFVLSRPFSGMGASKTLLIRATARKGGRYCWKPSSSSNLSIRAFRAYPLIEIRQTVPGRAIRGNSISVNGTLPPLLTATFAVFGHVVLSPLAARKHCVVFPCLAALTVRRADSVWLPWALPQAAALKIPGVRSIRFFFFFFFFFFSLSIYIHVCIYTYIYIYA